jgi:hypothetical protein
MLTMKPDRSLVRIGHLPISSVNADAVWTVLSGVEPDHDLDQLHHRHRREKMQSDHALGAACTASELGDRDRRCVRGQEPSVGEELVELCEQLALDRQVLGHSLDYRVRFAQILEPGGVDDKIGQVLGVLRGELAAGDSFRDRRLQMLTGAH